MIKILEYNNFKTAKFVGYSKGLTKLQYKLTPSLDDVKDIDLEEVMTEQLILNFPSFKKEKI